MVKNGTGVQMGSAVVGVWEGRDDRWRFKEENKRQWEEGAESKERIPSESTFQPLVRIAFSGSRHTNMSQYHPYTCLKNSQPLINCHTTPCFLVKEFSIHEENTRILAGSQSTGKM